MKTLIVGVLFFVALVARGEGVKLPHVSVFGTAEIKVVPDEMIWSLSVESKGNEVELVAGAHDKKVATLLKFLKEQKIEDKKLRTSRIELSENLVYRDRNKVKEGYIASTQVSFRLSDLEKYRTLWLGISKQADVSVKGVDFDSSQRIKYQNESRLKAVKAAKEKAQALAEALDSTIHEPLLIEEQGSSTFNLRNNSFMTNVNGGAIALGQGANWDSIALGTISVTTSVQVKFRISSK